MTDRDPGSVPTDTAEAELLARRRTLEARLAAQRLAAKPSGGEGAGTSLRGAADGMRLASEFVAGVLAGAGIGYLIDRLAGTQPFGLVFFLLLGFVAGVLNVLRSIGKAPPSGPVPAPPPGPAGTETKDGREGRE